MQIFTRSLLSLKAQPDPKLKVLPIYSSYVIPSLFSLSRPSPFFYVLPFSVPFSGGFSPYSSLMVWTELARQTVFDVFYAQI